MARVDAGPGHWLRLASLGAGAWSGIEQALADPGLPGPPRSLPQRADPDRRAQVAARELRARCSGRLTLLVDDLEALDAASAAALAALARLPQTAIVVAAERSPAWCDRAVVLPSWSAEALASLATQLLEQTPDPALLARWVAESEGRPGRLVDRLEASLASPTAAAAPLSATEALEADLACLVALSRRCWTLPQLAHLSGEREARVEAALRALHSQRRLRLERGTVCAWDRQAVAALQPRPTQAAALHLRLALAWAEGPAPRAWLVPHLVGAKTGTRRCGWGLGR